MAKKNKVLGVLLADRSGSMVTCRLNSQEAINGFFTERGNSAAGLEYWSLDQFDDKYEEVFGFTEVSSVPTYSLNPRGSTALMDSIGQIIKKLEFKTAEKGFKTAKPIVVIVTDGYENASVEHTKASIKALIEAKTADGWQFIYLGANQDALKEGSSYGISTDNSLTYNTNFSVNATASASNMMTRGLSGQGYAFSVAERHDSMDGSSDPYGKTEDNPTWL